MKAILKDLQPYEVSLVQRPANRRSYLLLKSEDGGNHVDNERMNAIVATEAENEQDFRSILAKADVTGEDADGVIAAFRLFNAYRETLTPEAIYGLAGAMGVEVQAGGTEGAADNAGVSKSDEPSDVLAKVPANVRNEIEGIFKSMEDMKTQNEALRLKIEKAERAELRRQFVAKAEELDNISAPEGVELADLLLNISEKAPDAYGELEKVFETLNTQIEKSGLFSEFGGPGARRPDSAEAELNTRVAGLLKETPTMSKADAMDAVMKSDRDLQRRYLEETR